MKGTGIKREYTEGLSYKSGGIITSMKANISITVMFYKENT